MSRLEFSRPPTQDDLSRLHFIDEALLAEANARRVNDPEAREWGFRGKGDLSGIVFPYFDLDGTLRCARLRRDTPELDTDGRPRGKYLSTYGDLRMLYFPPGATELLGPDVPVLLVEAEKSALALMSWARRHGTKLLAVATGGCNGWRGRTGKEMQPDGSLADVKGPLPGFADLACEGREIFICFDANARTNPNVRRARAELANYLASLGVNVRIADLPEMDRVNGPDDLIAEGGDEAMAAVLESARTWNECALSEATTCIEALAGDGDFDAENHALDLIAQVDSNDNREQLIRLLVSIRRSLTRKEAGAQVSRRRMAVIEERQQARENARRHVLLRRAVSVADLIRDLETFFSRRLWLAKGDSLILALWTLNAWVYDFFRTTPYLLLESSTRGCGKTTALELLEYVCPRPRRATSLTEAVTYRLIDAEHPTLLVDEAELLEGRGDRAEAVRAVANSGYKRGGNVPRAAGENYEVQLFDTYCPKVFACIGGLSGALLDRCIVLHLEKAPKAAGLLPMRQRELERIAPELRERLEPFALQAGPRLAELDDAAPNEGYWPWVYGRAAELWTGLLLIAKIAGREVEERAVEVARAHIAQRQVIDADEQNAALARELLELLDGLTGETFSPKDIFLGLLARETGGAYFDSLHGDRARIAAIGRFLSRYRIDKAHRSNGSVYRLDEAREKLRRAHPEAVTPEGELLTA